MPGNAAMFPVSCAAAGSRTQKTKKKKNSALKIIIWVFLFFNFLLLLRVVVNDVSATRVNFSDLFIF